MDDPIANGIDFFNLSFVCFCIDLQKPPHDTECALHLVLTGPQIGVIASHPLP